MSVMSIMRFANAVICLTIVVGMALVAGCSNESEPMMPAQERPTVALIMKSLANEFFVNMANGAEQHHSSILRLRTAATKLAK